MAAEKLTNITEVKKFCNDFKKMEKPTLAGLCRKLKVSAHTFYNKLDRDDEIGHELRDAYMYLIERHEEGLWGTKPVPHMFYLKTIGKLGFRFKEDDPITEATPKNVDVNINIVKPKKNDTNSKSK